IDDPTDRYLFPAALYAVNLDTGERRKLTDGDAAQPHWSPSGARIAFWSMDKAGIRDIKTISRAGGEAVSVTNDVAVDWNPVWSPDGKYLYFASNRGGSMNFWRVAVDEKTGKTLGNPVPFTTPSMFSQNLTVAADGKTLAYVQIAFTTNIFRAEFDARAETLSQKPIPVAPGARIDRNPAISPDGEWLAFDAIKDKQEDLFIMRRDGSNLLQLTNDVYKDRAPRWSHDGEKIIFYSDRAGKNESWTINPNGSGLQQISFDTEPFALLAFWSPDGKKMIQNVTQNYPKIFEAEKPLNAQTPFEIPDEKNPDVWAMAFSWSPDGEKIASIRMNKKADDDMGVVVYSFASNKHEELSDFGDCPVWLNDSRRLIFFDKNKIFLLDTLTKKTKELASLASSETLQNITISPDNRFVYYSLQKKESNLWMATAE
ncbi:MAG TPA: hypothetical protein VK308_11845, partial [Pyrinomonadaceae bacterium]|nr:hypothetical protein [Pyrinomonadaceae bacterium]